MNNRSRPQRLARRHAPKGIAAVECALTAPLLTLLVLGAIDLGQFANVHQVVSDASRAGARAAAKYDTVSVSQVKLAVFNYLEESTSGGKALAEAATVSLSDSVGNAITGSGMTAISTGSPVTVQVTVNFESVRWIGHVPGLNGSQIMATTTMRRE